MKQLKTSIGTSDFRMLIEEGCLYVDKTMFIDELLTQGARVTLFTRPRRFGKTLNMTMFREFFDITKDSKNLFRGLKIATTQSYQYMNSYPTLYFSFKDCKGTKKGLIRNVFKILLIEYDRYAFLKEKLSAVKKRRFEQILQVLEESQFENAEDVNDGIEFLMEILSSYYQKKVVLLIDEYDTPLEAAYANGFYDEVHSFIGGLYASALKDNPYLEKGVLTGIQRIAKENIFSGLNNLKVYSVLNTKYSAYFGLTEVETSELLESKGMHLTEDVTKMYNGYRFGGTKIFNPWSVLNYVDDCKLDAYWVNTASNTVIKSLIMKYKDKQEFASAFECLMEQNITKVSITTTAAYAEEASMEALWALLLHSGYITLVDDSCDIEHLIGVKIPNYEVKLAFKQMISEYTNLKETSLKLLFDALIVKQDMEAFKRVYQELVYISTSFYDSKENAYHMLFLGMCMYLDGYYEVRSNIEAGSGRSDIILKSLKQGYKHFIIEFKQGKNLDTLVQKALSQIVDKNYTAGLHGTIVLVGVAHNKKKCQIADREIIME